MPKLQKDNLFDLIKSLSKSEKRQFKLYVGRVGMNEGAKFMILFNALEKLNAYSEIEILKNESITKVQLSNIKAHLYKQILISLRLNPSNQNIRLQIREQLDFATILYEKGLYGQSLKILDKAKGQALHYEQKNIAYEIIELEKIIESQYITRSLQGRAEKLVSSSQAISKLNMTTSKWSNISLQLYGLFLKQGYVKNDNEYKEISAYFQQQLPVDEIESLGFREKLWRCKAYLWYSFLVQDFKACYKYSKTWVGLFNQNPEMVRLHPVFFIRGQQYLLEALFYIRDIPRFAAVLRRLEAQINQDTFPKNDNINTLVFLHVNAHKINLHFMKGTFEEGITLVPQIIKGIEHHKRRADDHHVMLFYYKIACLYFGAGKPKQSIQYLGKIIANKSLGMREDLLCFSRILNLVAHYEAGEDYHLESLIKSTYKFLLKMEDLYKVQKEIIFFLKSLYGMYPHQLKMAFKNLHTKLKALEDDPYERRSFLYLDILSWLDSHITGKSIASIIAEKSKLDQY